MGLHSFSRDNRILRKEEYDLVFGQGVKLNTRNLLLFVRQSSGAIPRLGMAITRKTGNAVMRNRTRRVLREVFRLNKQRIPGGMDIVVVLKRGAEYPTLAGFEKDFLYALKKYERNFSSSEPF